MTPYMQSLMEFMDTCDRANRDLYCPSCAKWGARSGFHDPWLLADVPCGVLLCRGCGFLVVVPRGCTVALIPPESLLRRILLSTWGDLINQTMAAIRLQDDGLKTLRFSLRVA